jgi:serine/threonine protein kinase
MLGEAGQVLIGDFGLAINVVKERPVSRVGTLDYMPPEVRRCPCCCKVGPPGTLL